MVDSNSGSDLISWRISGKCIFVSIIGSSCAICCFGITGSQLQSSSLSSWKDSDKPGEEKLLILPHHFPVKIESYFWNALLFSCQNRINLCSSLDLWKSKNYHFCQMESGAKQECQQIYYYLRLSLFRYPGRVSHANLVRLAFSFLVRAWSTNKGSGYWAPNLQAARLCSSRDASQGACTSLADRKPRKAGTYFLRKRYTC